MQTTLPRAAPMAPAAGWRRCTPATHRSARLARAAAADGRSSTERSANEASSSRQQLPPGWGPAVAAAGAAAGAASQGAAPTASSTPTPQQQQSSSQQQHDQQQKGKRVVIVGGGWGGFGAALAAAKAGAQVTLLDASESPGGLSSAFLSEGGRTVEPGIKGFWRCYSNIRDLLTRELSSEMGGKDPLTPYARSGFFTPDGLEVESPVFADLPRLPAPLGTFFHTLPLFRRLPLADRATALGLVAPLLEHDADATTYAEYDATSAHDLFRRAGVSSRLYRSFLEPMLLVTLFAPPTELSAAAALGTLYYFALAHQADWDVQWCKGPVGELIMAPFVRHLEKMGVKILGGRRVTQVLPAPGSQLAGSVTTSSPAGGFETFEADAIILAAGVPALQRLVSSSPVLAAASDLRAACELRASDVLACRVWLDRAVKLPFASNVLSGFDAGSGATLFDLSTLQPGAYASEPGQVLELDVYHAEALLPLSDDEIINTLTSRYLPAALSTRGRGSGGGAAAPLSTENVLDASVLRFKGATTVFSPGSAAALPAVESGVGNVFVAGDCVAQGPGTHGAKGLSQEKAYVTGLQAGNAAARLLGLTPRARVLPVEPDEPQIAAAKEAARAGVALRRVVRAAVPGPLKLAAF